MKKILFALSMLAFVVSALPQARGDDVSVDFFYNNLSGGNWIDVEGYGYGWQPDVAVSDPNWRPYTDGYWAYTDYGWTWISYEDFGWATYHYGRWARLTDYGWVWIPGSDLDWGPAWVSWRTGGDHIGWAPLPPRGAGIVYEGQPIGARVDIEYDIGPEYYNFCDVRFIGEPVLRDRIFPATQNVTYINSTVNVTNITVQNNVVYNYGPDINTVSAYSSRPIQRLTIERQAATDLSAAAKSGALTKVQGNKLLVGAPNKVVKAPANIAPPAVKAKVAQPKVEHGWSGVQNKAELEQKIKTENPKNIPPPTHAAARPAGSAPPAVGASPPAAAGPKAPIAPGPRGKAGRIPPGGIATSPAGGSPLPFERGKARGRPGREPQPGVTAPPGTAESPAALPSAPGAPERGKGRGRPGQEAQPGMTVPPGGAQKPFNNVTRGQPSRMAPPEQTAPAEAQPPKGKQRGRFERGVASPPPGQPGGGPPSPMGNNLNNSKSNAFRAGPSPEQPGGTMGTNLNNSKSNAFRAGPPPGQPGVPASSGAAPGEARGARERGQGAYGQPAGQPRGGAPTSERAPAQPAGGKKKPERGTPPPGPQ